MIIQGYELISLIVDINIDYKEKLRKIMNIFQLQLQYEF